MRKLASDSVIYGLGSVAQQALSFLLLPLYTRYLAPEEYGTLALISAVGGVIGLFATLGVHSGLVRIFFEYQEPDDRAAVAATAWAFAAITSVAVGLTLELAAPWIAPWVLDVEGGALYLRYAIVLNCLLAVGSTFLATLQAYQRPRPYIASTLAGLVVAAGLNIFFVAYAGLGVAGVLQGQIAGVAVQLGLSAAASLPRLRADLRGVPLRQMLAFAVPLLPTNLAAWGLSLADRWFLKEHASMADVGLYALGYRFGTVLETVFMRPFQQAWFPYLFSILNDPSHREICVRVLEYYAFLGGAFVLALALFSGDVIDLIADPSYAGADIVVFWIGIGLLLRGMTFITVAGIQIARKTHYSAFVYIVGAIANVAMLAVLVPRHGMMGAAWATVLTYLGMSLALYAIAQRLHPIPYRLDRVAFELALVAGLYLAGRRLAPEDRLAAVALKLGLLAAFPAILVGVRFFRAGEVDRARAALRRALGR